MISNPILIFEYYFDFYNYLYFYALVSCTLTTVLHFSLHDLVVKSLNNYLFIFFFVISLKYLISYPFSDIES